MKKTKKENSARMLLGVAGLTVLGLASYLFHEPDEVKNACWRSTHRDNGWAKKAFEKAWQANWQTIKQLVLHGEVCNAYKIKDSGKYYTGHSRNCPIKSVNPFK